MLNRPAFTAVPVPDAPAPPRLLAELRCLSCGRHLADLVRLPAGRSVLDHPAGLPERPLLVRVEGGRPHCAHCGGRAWVERPLLHDLPARPPVRERRARSLQPAA